MSTDDHKKEELLMYTTEIVSSFVAHNTISTSELPALIQQVYKTVNEINENKGGLFADRPQPAVPIKKSIQPDYVVCLEDGKKLKMLKRHLKTAYGMTPDDYRERWGLPADYPMVAPNYAKKRSALAKNIGLGTRPRR